MLSSPVRLLRRIARGLLTSDSPTQLAAGITLGMVIGLMPKGNLIALSLCVLLFSLRVNKGLALVAAVLFSAIGPWADSFSHKLGLAILSTNWLQGVYASVLSVPLGPWLGFQNTVVTGSLMLGLYAAYPVFWTTRLLGTRLSPSAANRHERGALQPADSTAQCDPMSGVAA
jgi:uncharacterized protein (TIGR03546 family)